MPMPGDSVAEIPMTFAPLQKGKVGGIEDTDVELSHMGGVPTERGGRDEGADRLLGVVVNEHGRLHRVRSLCRNGAWASESDQKRISSRPTPASHQAILRRRRDD